VNGNLVKKERGNMTASVNTILALTAIAVGSTMILVTGVAQQPLPQTTKDSIKGQASVTTERLKGTVEYVEGNYLVVRTADGNIRRPEEGHEDLRREDRRRAKDGNCF